MKKSILSDLKALLDEPAVAHEDQTEAAATSEGETAIMQHLALAAQVAGIDLDDDGQLKDFIAQVREVITKDKSKLKSQLRRWTTGKARSAIKATKSAI